MLKRTLTALIEVELEELRRLRPLPAVPAAAVADEVVRYLDRIPKVMRDVVSVAIESLDALGLPFSLLPTWLVPVPLRPFSLRPLDSRVKFMRRERWAGLPWQGLSYALSICWLVLFSRPDVRDALGAAVLPDPAGALPDDVVPPIATDAALDAPYDVCVIGSGAAGALVAYRLGAAGKRVLLIDSGRWIPPQQLSARHDEALATLYMQGGAQPALPDLAALFAQHPAGINFLQANVFGGGPYVNNAIQLPIERARFDAAWRPRGFPFAWDDLAAAMNRVASELQCLSPHAAVRPGNRSTRVLDAARALWPGAAPNPVSVWDCVGCGGCNVGCRYNRKTGGPHGARPADAPSSYLMRAILGTGGRVALHSQLKAVRFELDGAGRATRLIARDLRDQSQRAVAAPAFVVAAGPVASSRILQETDLSRRHGGPRCGDRVAANVTVPVSCVMRDPVGPGAPRPGLQMCFYVEPETGLLLEGWFDYPAGISTASTGLPADTAALVGDYARANILGVVVPVDDLASVHPPPVELKANISDRDYQRILRAVAHAACALYRSGASSVTPGHRLNTNVAGPLVIDVQDALGQRVDKIAADLGRRLGGPQSLSLQTPHPQGGNPIADSPARGVVAPSFKVYGTSNVFVADSSLFPAGCGRNPQLTTMGLAQLAADSIAGRLGSNDLGVLAQ